MAPSSEEVARRLWHALEPLHAVVYFAPEVRERCEAVGLRGFWRGYFAGRALPLGRPPAEVVAATFFGFHPAMVARAVPEVWSLADPADVAAARIDGVHVALRRLLGPAGAGRAVEDAADLASEALAGCEPDGRPLFAAHLALPWPEAPLPRLWHAATLLREHRGDGHVAANVAHRVSGLEAHVLFAATGAVDRSTLQPNRGWSDDDWASCEQRLGDRGLLVGGRPTAAGTDLRAAVEDLTDRLAAGPAEHLGRERAERLVALATPLALAVVDGGGVPVPNPMGVPRPAGAWTGPPAGG